MKTPYDIVLTPVLTEESYAAMEGKKYTFVVAKDANKYQIKDAVEEIFKVKVLKVNTSVRPGKPKRMGRFLGKKPTTKRATVTLTPDSKGIEIFEGMA